MVQTATNGIPGNTAVATTPNHHAVRALLDQLGQPMLLFNVAGTVTYANSAARALPGRLADSLSGHPLVRSVVKDVTLGNATLPQPARLKAGQGDGEIEVQGRFVTGPTGVDVALLLDIAGAGAQAPDPSAASGELHLRQVIDLISSELVPPIQELLRGLAALPPAAASSDVRRSALEVTDRLTRMVDLAAVFGDEVLVEDDRVVVPDLVRTVWRDLAPLAERYSAHLNLTGAGEELPPIYGSTKLLSRAVREILENAVRHARREVASNQALRLEARLASSGHHLLLSIRNGGATAAQQRAAETARIFTPREESGAGARIGLPLVRRIVELHGGQMRVGASDDSLEVVLQLPTGAPRHSATRMDVAQAQRYAADLAKLISRQRKAST